MMKALRVEGTLQAIEPIVKFAIQAAKEAGLDDQATFRIRLAVDELITNIIMHGYLEAGRSGDIIISSEIDEEGLKIYLEDYGVSQTAQRRPEPGCAIEERPLGGSLIWPVAIDQFHYEHDRNGNRSVLVLERPCPSKTC
ncbi:MAG: ATP-binding protein [Chloroflexi bacterium]|nr:ATP-binding protein [Chloroflexota bacterium]